jgi:hypothetical protein
MKSKIVRLIGAAMLFGMTSLGASAGVTVKWSTSLAPGSHPESVYYNSEKRVLYVSNIVGPGDAIDGNGYIARMSLSGQILPGPLATGLNGPKGMVLDDNHTLWVSDINRLVAIDTNTGAKRFYPAPGSVFLNDTAVDDDNNVYVSDIATRKIWRLKNGQMSEWVNTPLNPNGLLVVKGKLVVAGWGVIQPDDTVSPLGNLFTVDLKTKAIANLGNGMPIGTLDGLESDGMGNYLVTDFTAGKLYRIRPDGTFTELADIDETSADLEVLDKGKTAVIPFLLGDKVVAYTIN